MKGAAAVALLAVLLAPPAAAEQLAGVTLPDRVVAAGHELVLNGLGLREASVFMVDVYVAGLYLESRSSDAAAILEPARTKQLTMRFVRSVGKEKLVEAFTDGFEKNAGGKRDVVAPGLVKLNAAMTDVKKDDVIALTYVEDRGVIVTVKGQDVAVIAGADFQRVLFSIWLGAQPPNVTLREGLLGHASKR
jgi:hypothetical protein